MKKKYIHINKKPNLKLSIESKGFETQCPLCFTPLPLLLLPSLGSPLLVSLSLQSLASLSETAS